MRSHQHPNDPLYDWGPADPITNPIPADLVQHHRNFKQGYWGYVCPCCKQVFPPGLSGMPDSFRTHIRDFAQGRGCFFEPKPAGAVISKHANKAANF